MGRWEKADGLDEVAAYGPEGWSAMSLNRPVDLHSVVQVDMDRTCVVERAGVGHEAVDTVEDIPSWRRARW
jgi:hypothetical protein